MRGHNYKWLLVLMLWVGVGTGVTACAPASSPILDPMRTPPLTPTRTSAPKLTSRPAVSSTPLTPTRTSIPKPAPGPTVGPTTFVFSRADDYDIQYKELLAYANLHQLPHRVLQTSLADHAKVSQYSQDVVGRYGFDACGLVAAADSYGNSLEVMGWIRQAAAEAYGNLTGIQPTPYTKALKAEFGVDNVQAEGEWILGEMYQAMSNGDIVIADIKVKQPDEVPSAGGPNYSHFAKILGLDLDGERIYLENTLKGGPYWDISLREFWETWKYPETTVSIKRAGAEAVTRWAVIVRHDAAPHSPMSTPVPTH